MKFTILHNPRCSKSRSTLALLQEKGADVEIVEYLKNPPSAEELKHALKLLKLKPRDILRKQEAEYKEAGLQDETLTDDQVIEKMVAYPKVIERPIVIGKDKAVVGRPPENVLTLF